MEENKKSVFTNDCREIEGYNPYERAILLETETGEKKPYLCVNERIAWYTRYCEESPNVSDFGIITEVVPELTRQGMITMKATVKIGGCVYTGYGSKLVDGNEGYSGDDIESAETRAIGRALRNAGFVSPYDDGEDTPDSGFPPQRIPDTYAPLSEEQIIVGSGSETVGESSCEKMQETINTKNANAGQKTTSVSENIAIDKQIADMLSKPYPFRFRLWKDRPVYELLDSPELKKNLEWISKSYSGSTNIRDWATMLLKYVYPVDEADKQAYLAARKILIEKGLIR